MTLDNTKLPDEKNGRYSYWRTRRSQVGEKYENIPAFWSRELDKYLCQLFSIGEPLIVASKAISLASSRNLTLDNEELARLIEENSQNGEGLAAALRRFYSDYFLTCNGGFMYIVSSSQQLTEDEIPDIMSYGGKKPEFIQGPMIPLEDDDGRQIVLEDGQPIWGVGLQALDTFKCQRTGDLEYPVIYNAPSGSRIPIHKSRVIIASDNPSNQEGLKGVGKCAALRAARDAQMSIWDFGLAGEAFGDFPIRKIIYGKKGITGGELSDAIAQGANDVVSGETSIVVLGPDDDVAGDIPEMELGEIALKSYPPDYKATEAFSLRMIKMAAAFHLTPSELGFSLILNSASRATADAEEEAKMRSGIPEIQETVGNQINNKMFPDGENAFISEPIKEENQTETIKRHKTIGLTLTNLTFREIIGKQTAVELLYEAGMINEEQLEREIERIQNEPEPIADENGDGQFSFADDPGEVIDESGLLPGLIAAWFAMLNVQYQNVNHEVILDYIEENNLDPNDPDFTIDLLPIVEENTPNIDDNQEEIIASIAAALLALGERGIDSGSEDIGGEVPEDAEALLSEQIAIRLASLFEGGGNASPTVAEPGVENSLNVYSYFVIVLLYRQVLLDTEDRDEFLALYPLLAVEAANSRSELIGEVEAVFAYMLGIYAVGASFEGDLFKRWERTRSENPRQKHLDQVGEVVPFDDFFSSGEFFPGELPNCKCGITLLI